MVDSSASAGADTTPRRQTLDRLAIALCVLGAVLSALWCRGLRHEDAFIAFRYARNIASGEGFVLNPGERVLSTGAPLFTLLLALAYPILHDGIIELPMVISGAALGVQAYVVYRLLRDAFPLTALVTATLVFAGLAHPNHFFAMETSFAMALGLSTLWAFQLDRPKLTGVLLGLACLARFDAVLFALPLAFVARTEPRRLLPVALSALAVAAPWLLFATWYFGTPVPHHLGGKFGLTPALSCAKAFFSEAVQFPGMESLPKAVRVPPVLVALGFSLYVLFRRAPALFGLGLYGFAVLLLFACLGPPKGQTWYVYGGFLSLRVCAIAGLCGWVETRDAQPWAKPARLAALVSVGAYAAVMLWQLERFSHELRGEFWLGVRQSRYETVASYASAHFGPNRTMLSAEVASLGYLTGYRMIDPYGVVTDTNDWPRTQSVQDYAALVSRYQPHLILLDSEEAATDLLSKSPQLRYRVVKVFDWKQPWSTLLARED